MSDFKLSLVQRKNIKANEEKKAELLESLATATGKDGWEFEVDWQRMCELDAETNAGYRDTIGDRARQWLEKIIDALNSSVLNDEMGKEAFLEACSEPKIEIKFASTKDKKVTGPVSKFEDNHLVITVKNISDYYLGNDIEKLL